MMTAETDGRTTTPAIQQAEPDAHGQAAILLVESLIHALVARSVLSVSDAAGLIAIAMDAKKEISADRGESDDTRDRSLTLLSSILASLQIDETVGPEEIAR